MNKIKQNEVNSLIVAAHVLCGNLISNYRRYQPKLEHETAVKGIDETIRLLNEAKSKIIQVTERAV